jgi:outer membrane immunogenic protein
MLMCSLAARIAFIWGQNMRGMKSLAAAIMASALAGPVLAADLPTTKGPPVYVPPPPVMSWTGFYIGGDVGYAFGLDAVSPTIADGGTFPRTSTSTANGVFGGGVAGYNYQAGIFVLGLEADLGYMGLKGTHAELLGGTEVDHVGGGLYGDVTGRFGVTYDRALFYAKGGFALYDGSANTTSGVAGYTVGSSSGVFTGWTGGAGVEYAIAPQWSIRAEYLYFDFGSQTPTLTGPAGVFGYHTHLTAETAKIGVDYKFDMMAPIVAKY